MYILFFVTQMYQKKYEVSGIAVHKQTEADLTFYAQSTTDLPNDTTTTVRGRVTAINTKRVEDQSTVHSKNKPVVPLRKRSKTPTAHQTDELQAMLNKRSSIDLDSAGFEDYVQQGIQKQRSKISLQPYPPGGDVSELTVAFKKQQERFYVPDAVS